LKRKNKDKIIAIVLILCFCFLDGMRDGTLGADWLTRHIWKWLAFYGATIYILILNFGKKFWKWLWLAIPGWLVWWFAVKIICGKDWTSMWIRLFRDVFK